MKFCKQCGAQAPEGTQFCQNCGSKFEENENTVQYGQYGQYPQAPVKEKANVGFVILSVFFPIAGLILYFTQKDKEPNAHKTYLKAGIISFCATFVFSLIITISSIFIAGKAVKGAVDTFSYNPDVVISYEDDADTGNDEGITPNAEENVTSKVEENTNNNQNSVSGSTNTSTNWKEMTIVIDGETLIFPYDYEKLKSMGWSFNLSDYGKTAYILNPGDKVSGTIDLKNPKYGNDYSSAKLEVGFKNYDSVAKDITECDVWALKASCIFGTKKITNAPDIRIVNNIGFGSSLEEVEKAFGKSTDTYRSDDLGYTVYNYQNNYSQYARFVIYDNYGVGEIELKNFE